MSKYQDKDFLALKSKWYAKLEKQGFEDIEQEDGNLKFWTGAEGSFTASEFNEPDHTTYDAKATYYRLAGQFLHSYTFKDATEKEIWRMHSEGIGVRPIAKTLDTPRYRLYHMKVHKIVSSLAKKMLIDFAQEKDDS